MVGNSIIFHDFTKRFFTMSSFNYAHETKFLFEVPALCVKGNRLILKLLVVWWVRKQKFVSSVNSGKIICGKMTCIVINQGHFLADRSVYSSSILFGLKKQ